MKSRYVRACIAATCIAIAACMATDIDAARKKRTPVRDINKVRKEQTAASKAIKETSRKIDANTAETRRQLDRLSSLKVEIDGKSRQIAALQHKADNIAAEIKHKQDSITLLERQYEKLREGYIATLRNMQQAPASMNMLSFVFASDSFKEAWRRMRYMQQLKDWHKVKTGEIRTSAEELKAKQAELQALHSRHTEMLGEVTVARLELENSQEETNRIVAGLKKEQGALRAVLKENEAKAKKLDQELDRLIAEEQKKQQPPADNRKKTGKQGGVTAKGGSKGSSNTGQSTTQAPAKAVAEADRRLDGSFESNRGRLLFPVSGSYKIVRGFGIQKHPELAHVETNNNGIDVEVSPGTRVRSIFDGIVSAIFVQPGYNTIVMVRHGSYISIYAGLQNVKVAKGDKVKANDTLGSVSPDVENDNRAILHFELRREREKLNPLKWVK